MRQIAYILLYTTFCSVLVPIFFLLRRKQNFRVATIKILGLLLFASAFSDLLSYVVLKMGAKSNLVITNTYIIIQFLILSYIYHFLFKKKKIIYVAITLFVVFFIINVIVIQPYTEFQNWPRGVANMILIGYSMKYYFQLLDDMPRASIFRFYPFWLNTAVFYYFGSTFLIFISINYVMKTQSADFSFQIWGFHNLSNAIKNILFAVAIYYVGAKSDEAYDGKDMTKL